VTYYHLHRLQSYNWLLGITGTVDSRQARETSEKLFLCFYVPMWLVMFHRANQDLLYKDSLVLDDCDTPSAPYLKMVTKHPRNGGKGVRD